MFYKARRILLPFIFLVFIPVVLSAQRIPGSNPTPDGFNVVGPPGGTAPFDISGMGIVQLNSIWTRQGGEQDSPLLNPTLSVSKLDLKAPRKARQEFEKGRQLLHRKNYEDAMQHLSQAMTIYPDFVAAHEALGTSLLSTGRNQEARDEFAKAAVLDSHLPASYLNLGYAELALKHYSSARLAAEKAAAIAPLDLSVLSLLAYAQLMNKDYPASVGTADRVHAHNDRNHAIVHFYAAAAWDEQGRNEEERRELETLLREDPKSRAAEQARAVLQRIQQDKENRDKRPLAAAIVPTATAPTKQPTTAEMETQAQISRQNAKEEQQITEAEAMCDSCEKTGVMHTYDATTGVRQTRENGWTLHSDVDEVAVFFVATDHGKPVGDLAKSEVTVSDGGRPPTSVAAFRSEDQLPLRLGLVIDESESVTSRFSFERTAAADFLRKCLTGKSDLAFVVGVSNSVLLVQDFTADNAQLSEAINSLVPAGGTALWDAVDFAADKLARSTEAQPVAKVLVVISDGQDNSSRTTLRQAIEAAERADVTVYTVSTNDVRYVATAFLDATIFGDRALKNLAEHTGGNSFVPGSIGNLDHSLAELQEFIHNRYSLSYKPALLKGDDRYRTIHITAQKAGHKLRVYARKGYFARASLPQNSTP
jgi:Ca-activated chloride channel homolog